MRLVARRTLVAAGLVLASLGGPRQSNAACGCIKPPPPRLAIRPFVGHADQIVTIFDDRLTPGHRYDVQFSASTDGSSDWSRSRAILRRDLADGKARTQLRVRVGDVTFGPCRINVFSRGVHVFSLGDDQFTVTARPVVLHDFDESVTRMNFRAGVGRDGTVYIPVDVSQVTGATSFVGQAIGFGLGFTSDSVAMYNDQGFLMQLLDPTIPGLFQINRGSLGASDALAYWRHEFRTYREKHRKVDAYDHDDDPDWHADGTYHINHEEMVVAIRGTLRNGATPPPGPTPPFELLVRSVADERP